MTYAKLLGSASLAVFVAAAAQADTPRVVTDTPVVHALVSLVMGDLGTPGLLLDRGADAHNFQLRPSQARALGEAGRVYWIGPELTPWLDRALSGSGAGDRALALLASEGTILRAFDPDGAHDHSGAAHDHDHGHGHGHEDHGHDHDHAHGDHAHDHAHDDHAHEDHAHGDHAHGDHAHEDHAHGDHAHGDHAHDHAHDDHAHDDHAHDHAHGDHAHDHHDHAHDGTDPHAWLDPRNVAHWLDVIAADLAAIDPANAATYAANAAAARADIAALEAEIGATLSAATDAPFVVFHDAYGYLAARYGLSIAGSIALGDAAAPGAGRLAQLRAELASGGVVCAFPEAQHDPALVATLVDGTDVRIGATLDPSGSSLEPGADLYHRLMRQLAQGIVDCVTG